MGHIVAAARLQLVIIIIILNVAVRWLRWLGYCPVWRIVQFRTRPVNNKPIAGSYLVWRT